MRSVRSCSFLLLCLAMPFAAGRSAAQETPRAPAAERPARMERTAAVQGRSAMFQIALVLADNEPSKEPPQALPKGLQKALADIQDFLPFKSYRLYDSALVRSTGEARARLKGPDGQEYTAAFTFRDEDNGPVHNGYLIDPFSLDKTPAPSPQPPQPLPRGVAPRTPEPPQASSFRIRPGETVVVGSSGLPGGRSLIVVLTALP
jgi:hypothetical protein